MSEDMKLNPSLLELSSSSDPQNHEIVVSMIEDGADINGFDAKGNTLLQVAIQSEAFVVIEAILNLKKPANLTDEYFFDSNESPMALAMRSPNAVKLLTLFYKYRLFDFEKCCKLLPWDMSEDHLVEVVRTLLEISNKTKECYVLNWIGYFIWRNRKLAKLIIKCTTRSVNGMRSLQKLLPEVNTTITMAFFISEGAKIDECVNVEQQYPLHSACQTSNTEIIQLLLHLDADVNVTDLSGKTPFSMSFPDTGEYTRHDSYVDVSKRCMIQHFACLNDAGKKVNDKDLSFIRRKPLLQKFYESCMEELSRMKTIEAADGFPYHWFFSKTNYQLSWYLRDSDVCKQIKKSILRLGPGSFPIYWAEIIIKYGLAKKISNLVVFIERAIEEIFGEMFPCLVVCKITEYLFNLKKFEKEYHLNKLLEI